MVEVEVRHRAGEKSNFLNLLLSSSAPFCFHIFKEIHVIRYGHWEDMKRVKIIKTIITSGAGETRKLARLYAGKITRLFPERNNHHAGVISLTGNLGSGKTTFAQSFAKSLGVKETVNSPTFVIEKTYRLKIKPFDYLIHIDAYRLEKPKDLIHLGWNELVKNNRAIILIEWGDLMRNILPKNYIEIKFEHMRGDKRKIRIIKREA